MAGHQIWGPDSLGVLSKTNSTTMQLSSSTITVGGLQFDVSSLNLDLATGIDTGTVAADTLYYVYLVVSAGLVSLKYSLSSSSPTGFQISRKIGSFRTNSLSQIAGTSVKDQGKVGDIIHSMLTEEQFIEENGAGWILADGRNVAGTKYASLIALSVPDMRGQFLRGKNNGRNDGNEDPDGERAVGNFQNDAIRNITGRANTFPATSANHSYTGAFSDSNISAGNAEYAGGFARVHKTNFDFDASLVVPTANDNRPKNVAANIFIKVEDIVV